MTERRALLVVAGLALAFASWSGTAAAQPKTQAAAQPVDEQRAVELYGAGRELLSSGKASEALPKLRESLALLQSPNTELLVAHAHRELGHRVVALETYERVAASAASEIARGQDRYKGTKEEADRWSRELAGSVATLVVDAPPEAQLEVPVLGEGTRKFSGASVVRVDPGEVKVRATISGTVQEQKVQTLAGATVKVRFVGLDAGPAVGEPSADGGGSVVSIPGIVLGSVGLAAIGASIGFGVSAKAIHDELEPCLVGGACAADFDDRQAEGVLHRNLSNGMLGAGIGLIAVGATVWIIQVATRDSEPTTATPPSAWLYVDLVDAGPRERVTVLGLGGSI